MKTVSICTQLEGETYYFCSEHCLTKFTDSPQGYLSE
ncbi:MAG: YHS domain-containing protein [Gammaproteobacteria bacterium]|nr:YHS domain-containing protein [Gammaproteobacteria bacterium]